MTFAVGAIPFKIDITVPIDMVWNIQAQAKAILAGSISTQGSIRYGLQYKNGQHIPINQHTYSQKGNFDEVDLGTSMILSYRHKNPYTDFTL